MSYPSSIKFLCVGLVALAALSANAQTKFTISGTISDGKTGEALIASSVVIAENQSIGASSNEYGFYSLSLQEGTYTIICSYLGYEDYKEEIKLDGSKVINIGLKPYESGIELQTVVVTANNPDDNLSKPQMGTETLNLKDIEKIPVLLGEKDIIKTIQLLPGVKSTEGSSGFSVRGGATDQNLILLDEATVYNASHLLGFFSTFNSDALKDATIIKGNSPANYGGRLSSVLDVKMKEGSNKRCHVSGGLGLIASRLTVEGPIQKDKSSFIISGRRTYADLFLKASEKFKDNTLYFYDINAKANFILNSKHRIYASGYFGRDVLALGNSFGIDWGNTTGTLRWNYIINSKLFSNTSLIYSDYKYDINIKSGETNFNINSNIRDWNLKQDFSYYLNPNNTFRAGFNFVHHTINPTTVTGTVTNSQSKNGRQALEYAIYGNNTWKANDKFSVDYGFRGSFYTLLGGDTYNIYQNGVKTDSVVLESGKAGKTYFSVEPRLAANYRLTNSISLKAGYARNTQHLHLLSNSTGGNPSDQWIGNSYNIRPEIADQVSIGYSQNFDNNKYELGVESYFKWMQNQVDYKDGADIQTEPDVESQLLFGNGRAYGFELIFKKKEGKLTGWVSYTLSKTERQIDGINNGEWYNARQDRTHDLAIVANYQISPLWTVSGLFVYNTGNAVTFPTGKYTLNGNTIFQYSNRNADRMPAYHRFDLNFTKEFKSKKGFESSLSFGCYNIYGRENAYTITFRDNQTDPTKTEAVQTALFRWVPNVTYNFKF